MKFLASGAVLTAALVVPATADARYDRKLEEAVMAIVAEKIGAIRGGFAYDAKPELWTAADPMSTGATPIVDRPISRDGWTNGLAIAVERKVAPAVAN
jgi:hypothetical protein